MPVFSVIVPYLNAERYLARCVKSLLSQTASRDAYEVFLVDNGSRDESAAVAARYPGVICLREKKPGSYAARNRALRESSGQIVAFTDADCEADLSWLEMMREALCDPEVALVLGRTRYGVDDGPLSLLCDYEAEKAAYVIGQGHTDRHYAYTNNMAVRREVFTRLGPFLEWQRGADVVFVHHLVAAQGTRAIRYCAQAGVRHLEITRIRNFYRKQLIYGRSTAQLSRVVGFRPLTNRERFEVYRRTVDVNRYDWPKALQLLALLICGGLLYQTAWWRAKVRQVSGALTPRPRSPDGAKSP